VGAVVTLTRGVRDGGGVTLADGSGVGVAGGGANGTRQAESKPRKIKAKKACCIFMIFSVYSLYLVGATYPFQKGILLYKTF
jgi:hypothetical protein